MSAYVNLPGVRMWYDQQGTGEPLVMLHPGGAEASNGVKAIRERFTRDAEQHRTERAGKLAGCCHGAAEAVTGSMGC